MTVNDAVAKRVLELLKQNNMSQYRLEQLSGIQHGSMQCIMNGRNKTVTLNTILLLSMGFGITPSDFLDSELFSVDKFDIINN